MGRPCGWIVYTPCRRTRGCSEADTLKRKIHLHYQTTNNEAEYEALLKGLELAKSLGVESVLVQGDSQLVIG